MQIYEITEGFWRNVGSGFVQGVTGVDSPRQQPENIPTPTAAQAGQAKGNPLQGTIALVDVGGMEYFKNYQGQWFEKPDPAQRYVASLALQIKDPRKMAVLDKELPRAQTITVKPQSPNDNVVFVPDPSGRAAKLAAKRQQAKVRR